MKTALSVALLLVTLCQMSEAVQIKEGEYFYSIESVKVLQQLVDNSSTTTKVSNPRLATTSISAICANPTLPQEFVPLCQQKGAATSLSRLAAMPLDICEICAFAACTGC